MFAVSTRHTRHTALHITAIGHGVAEPKGSGEEPFLLDDFANTLYPMIPYIADSQRA
ncbi:hypothetical protein LUX12_16495 [Streptomyces somaliensis]|uniref:hypothetical protein n=1 Tax=Streptomyces somaliensis TaxID=78355 RepID=UPI0020CBE514|nr:hypothetical protein [Streptomyces somaliensis]MCP9946039.1 hypothetical protein [Streptomyces somaliensis]MCP9960793.1 hypothetical protein [Streptomyces somaliensis]MCP9973579.1 hypothetical protein [Streptomyces somaliensis]